MAEMTRPRAQTAPGAQAAGYGGQRRPPSIASEISLAAVVTAIGRARAYVTSIVTAWGLERVAACVEAVRAGTVISLEDGCPVT